MNYKTAQFIDIRKTQANLENCCVNIKQFKLYFDFSVVYLRAALVPNILVVVRNLNNFIIWGAKKCCMSRNNFLFFVITNAIR